MELESELRALVAEIDWPETPPLRVQFAPRRRGWRRPLLAAIAVAVVAAFAVPQSRGAILRFFGFGAVRVELVGALPAAQERPLGSGVGRTVSPSAAQLLLGSQDRKLLAVATSTGGGYPTSTIRFADVSTLTWVRKDVKLDGYFRSGLWPRPDVLYALVGDTLEAVNTATKKVVAKTTLEAQVGQVTQSATGLVVLGSKSNTLGPALLTVIDAGGHVRSTTLERIVSGTHFDQTSQDPIGTTRQSGLAVDDRAGIAYVVAPDGLIAEVRLGDLAVSYHQLGRSLIARLSAWLTPSAQAKGLNGPTLTARWLGDGLIAVAGTVNTTTKTKDGGIAYSTSPAGLRIVDTHDWSEHTLDRHAERMLVADGLLLAGGGSWRSATNSSSFVASGEGLVAYGPDGTVRWRLDPGKDINLLGAWGSRALIQAYGSTTVQPVQLIDLDSHRVLRSFDPNSYPWPLAGGQ